MSKFEHIKVVAVHGKAGAGKNYVSQLLYSFYEQNDSAELKQFAHLEKELKLSHHGTPRFQAFADTLKEHLFAIDQITAEEVVAVQKSKDLRFKLINTGDDLRGEYGKSYFAKALLARILLTNAADGTRLFIVTDLRELHELEFLRQTFLPENLKLCTVSAPLRAAESLTRQTGDDVSAAAIQGSHSTETGLDALTCDAATAKANGFIFFENDI